MPPLIFTPQSPNCATRSPDTIARAPVDFDGVSAARIRACQAVEGDVGDSLSLSIGPARSKNRAGGPPAGLWGRREIRTPRFGSRNHCAGLIQFFEDVQKQIRWPLRKPSGRRAARSSPTAAPGPARRPARRNSPSPRTDRAVDPQVARVPSRRGAVLAGVEEATFKFADLPACESPHGGRSLPGGPRASPTHPRSASGRASSACRSKKLAVGPRRWAGNHGFHLPKVRDPQARKSSTTLPRALSETGEHRRRTPVASRSVAGRRAAASALPRIRPPGDGRVGRARVRGRERERVRAGSVAAVPARTR